MSRLTRTDRLATILLQPYVNEKTMTMMGEGQIAFKVRSDATKPEIKAAVEMMLDKKVDAVRVINVRGKSKRFGQTMGKRKNWKKAYVKLAEGQDLDFLGLE